MINLVLFEPEIPVNTGNINLKFNAALTSQTNIAITGISSDYYATNSFNSGTLTLDDSTLPTPLRNDGLGHTITIGEIQTYYNSNASGNKFTNQNGFALGCYGVDSSCTLEQSTAVGTHTTENAPNIITILNAGGENAFNTELDEHGLPTLKVFNN